MTIENAIESIVEGNQYFEVNRSMNVGSVHRRYEAFEDAENQYLAFADTVVSPVDSLQSLIQVQKTIRYEASLNPLADYETFSQGNTPSRIVALAEKRITELNNEISLLLQISSSHASNMPVNFDLEPAYPNPFNPSVTIPFALPKRSEVTLTVYNILGKRVTKLVNQRMEAGYHQVVWSGRSQAGLPVASGVYFVTMEAGGFVKTQKLVMVK